MSKGREPGHQCQRRANLQLKGSSSSAVSCWVRDMRGTLGWVHWGGMERDGGALSHAERGLVRVSGWLCWGWGMSTSPVCVGAVAACVCCECWGAMGCVPDEVLVGSWSGIGIAMLKWFVGWSLCGVLCVCC